ncbi:RDD family protein [Pseudomonas sp. RGM2987]|uniref:RDD family protein n=1 Tax=Pseudomonas sp. RGM2987 TaxID=2930090 RepID=UPI001FD68BB1|nr:RDD family protein [Pseudomonas sp. RGM2987]MCJ8205721.1 RDD family protein [Pseudomonas sp. RGM2987]
MSNGITEVPAYTYDVASPLKRFLGYLVDLSVVLFIFLMTRALGSFSEHFNSDIGLKLFWGIKCFLILLGVLYILFCDALPNGQSIGKRVCHTSVVGFPYPTQCTIFQSVLRNFLKLFLVLSVLESIFVFFGLRRRLSDMLAKTIVVNS